MNDSVLDGCIIFIFMQVATPMVPVGTQDFLSPEVLEAMNGGPHSTYGVECDWWSLGVIAYDMIYSKLPFSDGTSTRTIHNILNYQVLTVLKLSNTLKYTDKPPHLFIHLWLGFVS